MNDRYYQMIDRSYQVTDRSYQIQLHIWVWALYIIKFMHYNWLWKEPEYSNKSNYCKTKVKSFLQNLLIATRHGKFHHLVYTNWDLPCAPCTVYQCGNGPILYARTSLTKYHMQIVLTQIDCSQSNDSLQGWTQKVWRRGGIDCRRHASSGVSRERGRV